MKIFAPKKNFCRDCQFSFKKDGQLFCAKTINMTQEDNTCEIFEVKNKKRT